MYGFTSRIEVEMPISSHGCLDGFVILHPKLLKCILYVYFVWLMKVPSWSCLTWNPRKYLENYRWNIWTIFLERTWRGSLGKYLDNISGKNLRGITGEIFVGYFEDFRENIDHYTLFVDINLQTNILKWNLKFILNLERVWENFKIWIFGMLQIYPT